MKENLEVFGRLESNVRSYCRSFPVVFDRAEGSILYDTEKNRYIDFVSGAGALNYGHNEPDIHQAVIDYLKQCGIVMSLDKHTTSKQEFIAAMESYIFQPRKLDYKIQFTSPSGTSSVESAVKLARKYTGRNNIVAFTNGFHGMTGISLSLTGSRFNRQSVNDPFVTRLPYDGYIGEKLDTLSYFRKLLEDQSSGLDIPAAVILETVQGEGGLNVARSSWLKELSKICKEFSILLIVDDIQAGCGRTGRFFSFERAEIYPDIVCMSKSIGGLGLPLAIVLIKPHLDVWSAGEDNGTFRGNNLAFIASTVMLRKYWSDESFQSILKEKENFISSELGEITREYSDLIKEHRGLGLMQGLEFRCPNIAGKIKKSCFDHNLLIECCGDRDQTLKLMPALTIEMEHLISGVAIIEQVIGAYASSYARAAVGDAV